MINQDNLCFGQRVDPELGILEPWYTNPAMDVIKKWDLSGKTVLEYGGGASTIWWSKRVARVLTIDHNQDWYNFMLSELDGGDYYVPALINTHEGDQSEARDWYVEARRTRDWKFDIVVVDGIHRYECAKYAVEALKPKIIIIDNHQQDYVFMCPALDELMKGVRMERYIQPDHTDHSGNPWATAIFYLD